ncbi:MAG: hypothetical protein KQI35_01210 [Bacteroidetes bacterium]|nr:hypothetical protein [Bacteroidota bacterium]
MARINLIGNWTETQFDEKGDYFNISIEGTPSLTNEHPFRLSCHLPIQKNTLTEFIFTNQLELFKFSEKIRGIPLARWHEIISELRGEEIAFNTQSFVRIYQENFLKSIFMLYYWLDLSLLEKSIDIEEMIFDQVILEYTSRPGKVNFLYCVPKNMVIQHPENLNELVRLNMLYKIEIESFSNYETFCVPFFELGIPVRMLKNDTKKIWDKIILKANKRVKNIFR